MQAKSERFELRLEQGLLDKVDGWRGMQRDLPSRAEAVRRLLEAALDKEKETAIEFSPAERLIVAMLGDVYRKLGISGGHVEIDVPFVMSAIQGGHFWALRWELPGIFHDHSDGQAVVREVVDTLDMWDLIETSYEKFSDIERKNLAANVKHFGNDPKFIGYDGNNESEYFSIARFIVNDMKRFTRFTDRGLNSHVPMVDAYRRMVRVFEPIRVGRSGRLMTADEVASLLVELTHPENRV